MRLKPARRGFALVLALFLILVLYTAMTVMMANFKTDSALSQNAFESAQARFAARGAVNKLLTLLRNGHSPDEYSVDHPLEVAIGDLTGLKAWVVEGETTGFFHLCSSYQGESYTRVVTQSVAGGARIYTNDGGTLKSADTNDTTWTAVPSPPPRAYDPLTGLEVDCADLTLTTTYFRANSEGQVGGVYNGSTGRAIYLWDETTNSWNAIPPAPGWRTVGSDIEPGGPADIRNHVSLGERTLFAFDNLSVTGGPPRSVVSTFDLESQTWSDVRGPFDGTRLLDGFVGPDDSFIGEVEHGGQIHLMQLTDGEWTELPPLPGGVTLAKARANGPEGNLYAEGTGGQLFRLADGAWSPIDIPSAPGGGSLGALRSVDAEGGLLFYNTTEQELYRWDETSDPVALPAVEDWQGVAGGGNGNETVSEGYSTTASY